MLNFKVEYDTQGFLEKNRDTIPPGMTQLLQHSENKLITQVFSGIFIGIFCANVNSLEVMKNSHVFFHDYPGYDASL